MCNTRNQAPPWGAESGANMAQQQRGSDDPMPRTTTHDPALIRRVDRALLQMRRRVVRPETNSVPIPALEHPVDFAKVMACLAVSDLQGLADPPGPVTVKDVALALGLEHSTASRLLAETAAEGFVHRTTDPADRRRTVVTLTTTGDMVVTQSSEIRAWAIDLMLAEWASTDLQTFAGLIERFTETIDARAETVIAQAQEHFGGSGPDRS